MLHHSASILFIADVRELVTLVREALTSWNVTVAAGVHDAMSLTHRARFDVVACGELSSACAVREFVMSSGTTIVVFSDARRDDAPRDIRFAPQPRSADAFRASIEALLDMRDSRPSMKSAVPRLDSSPQLVVAKRRSSA